jgi:hypothetical protein
VQVRHFRSLFNFNDNISFLNFILYLLLLLVDPLGAQKEVLDVASCLGLEIIVAVAYESSTKPQGIFF